MRLFFLAIWLAHSVPAAHSGEYREITFRNMADDWSARFNSDGSMSFAYGSTGVVVLPDGMMDFEEVIAISKKNTGETRVEGSVLTVSFHRSTPDLPNSNEAERPARYSQNDREFMKLYAKAIKKMTPGSIDYLRYGMEKRPMFGISDIDDLLKLADEAYDAGAVTEGGEKDSQHFSAGPDEIEQRAQGAADAMSQDDLRAAEGAISDSNSNPNWMVIFVSAAAVIIAGAAFSLRRLKGS